MSSIQDSLPLPDDNKKTNIDDSLVVNTSLNGDLDISSLIDIHNLSNSDIEISEQIELEDKTSSIFGDFEQSKITSSIVENISDKGISLEGGINFDKKGNIDSWNVDLGLDYANPDSGTQLLKNSELYNLELENKDINPDSSFFEDSLLDSPVYLEKNHTKTEYKNINIYPEYKEPAAWLVFLIIFVSGIMLFTAITVLDIMVCNACPAGKNCHTPLFILILRDLGFKV